MTQITIERAELSHVLSVFENTKLHPFTSVKEYNDYCRALATIKQAVAAPAQELVAGLERCKFDDECEFCKSPEGGSFTRLIHNAEDTTEAEFYICGACVHTAINRYTTQPAKKQDPHARALMVGLKKYHENGLHSLSCDDHASTHYKLKTSGLTFRIWRLRCYLRGFFSSL